MGSSGYDTRLLAAVLALVSLALLLSARGGVGPGIGSVPLSLPGLSTSRR